MTFNEDDIEDNNVDMDGVDTDDAYTVHYVPEQEDPDMLPEAHFAAPVPVFRSERTKRRSTGEWNAYKVGHRGRAKLAKKYILRLSS